MVKVVLVDDHELVRDALSKLLSAQSDITVMGQASSVCEAEKLLKEVQTDVIILDLLMPHESGAEFAVKLLETRPELGVLIVSSRLEPAEIQQLVEAGIRGYVPKTAPADEFLRAVRSIGQGLRHFSQEAASALAESVQRGQNNNGTTSLSFRQTVVLRRMARGLTTKEIADEMCLSPKTVEKYRSEILRRLHCKNQVQAIELARKLNMLED